MRLIAVFNLKPGIASADYEAWARRTDLPTVNALPSIGSFRVFKSTGKLGAEGNAPYAYIETIDVDDMEQFWRDVATPAMQKISAEFGDMVDVTFITTEEIKA